MPSNLVGSIVIHKGIVRQSHSFEIYILILIIIYFILLNRIALYLSSQNEEGSKGNILSLPRYSELLQDMCENHWRNNW
jgi:hypothetical protein